MPEAVKYSEMSEGELLELRPGLAWRVGALMRAWNLGMVSPRNEKEQELFEDIISSIPAGPRPAPPEDTELTRLTDEDFLQIVDVLISRYAKLGLAYRWGMITASRPGQESALAELREIFDDN